MAKPDTPDKPQVSDVEHVSGDVFSSEKREDIWALIIVVAVFLFCVAFPSQIYHFFTQTLFLF